LGNIFGILEDGKQYRFGKKSGIGFPKPEPVPGVFLGNSVREKLKGVKRQKGNFGRPVKRRLKEEGAWGC